MDYKAAVKYLEEAGRDRKMVLGLENMRSLMKLLDNPQNKLKYVHIAGTNGKGSAAAYISSILKAAGLKTGRYTSPAVFSFTGQFQINGEAVSEEELAEGMTEIILAAESMESRPTRFELETAFAFWYFAKQGCDIAVIETGLGGDEDATNIIETPVCCVLTSISMDHSRILGRRIEEIAAHKAGIIKRNVPVVCIEQQEAAMEVIKRTCDELSGPLYIVKKDEARMVFSNKHEAVLYYKDFENIHIHQTAVYQKDNAALAMQTAAVLADTFNISHEAVREGMETARWKGRFDIREGSPDIILDGAHNPDGARQLKLSLDRYYANEPLVYIMGMLADKDYETVVSILLGRAAMLYTVTPDSPRALDKHLLKEAAAKRYPQLKITEADSVSEALNAAQSGKNNIVVCGTLSFLGEADKWITENRKA